ncbi:hypothetical protein C2G38_2209170 [Gigaspora rosea]|uniref:F-box domain-containing protein n=1 Tax=Gigaspora rosea TaxID=44941 RepID=A0A397UQB9_9GLOM|nr:hypothetical protein C2G38_2209170 [Gigaspora rosea]
MLNLDGYDLIMFSMVNKSIRSQTQDNLLWRKICFREFPNDIIRMNYKRKDISLNNNNWFNLWKEFDKKNSTIIFAEQPELSLMIPPCWIRNESDVLHPKIIKTTLPYFDVHAIFDTLMPGIYQIVWEIKIGPLKNGQNFKFITKVSDKEWKKTINYAYKPKPYEIENLSTKGWFKFKVPNKIFVHEKNSKVKTELRRYTSLEENEISLWIKSMELYSVQLVRCQK